MKTIESYYNERVLKQMLNSVSHPGWRVWKVQQLNGAFRQNTLKINSVNKLRKFLGKQPSKVYVSIAQFLNPQRVYGKITKKAQWVVGDSLFLGSDLLFDFDHKDLRIALKDAQKVYKFMKKEKDYELINIRYSGTKGFHLLYKDNMPVIERDPEVRLSKTEKRRKELVDRLPNLRTIDEVHKTIICDQFRVHAVLNSIKAKTGHKVELIPEKTFISLKHYQPTRAVRRKPMITDERIILTSTLGKEGSALTSYPFYYNFVDSTVKGTKNQHIVVLKYPKGKKVDIKALQERYKLSHFFKFEYKKIDMYICFKLLSQVRVEKIMKYAKPMNLNSFMYYGHTWIPISEAVNNKGNIIWEKPVLIEIIESKYALNHIHSRPHATLLNLTFNKMAGRKQNRICKAIISGVQK